MLRSWKVAMLGIALATAPVVGCASAPPRYDRVYVRREPPPPRRKIIVESPGPDYVYIRGHWASARDGDYVWVPGRWVRPEGRRQRWVDGHWAHDRAGWYYVDGHWR